MRPERGRTRGGMGPVAGIADPEAARRIEELQAIIQALREELARVKGPTIPLQVKVISSLRPLGEGRFKVMGATVTFSGGAQPSVSREYPVGEVGLGGGPTTIEQTVNNTTVNESVYIGTGFTA